MITKGKWPCMHFGFWQLQRSPPSPRSPSRRARQREINDRLICPLTRPAHLGLIPKGLVRIEIDVRIGSDRCHTAPAPGSDARTPDRNRLDDCPLWILQAAQYRFEVHPVRHPHTVVAFQCRDYIVEGNAGLPASAPQATDQLVPHQGSRPRA